jgi:hypothetical protein
MKWMRATTQPSFLDLVDLLGRGSTEDWQELYAEAKENPQVRALIEEALPFVDPEIGEAKTLWRFLLDSMPTLAPTTGGTQPRSQSREHIQRIASP